MVPEPDKRVDELRQQLRSLGYLDAGVDRFVLGGARERRGPIGIALRTSVRVGLLGGVLLGPAAAIGLGARLPGLISGGRDAAVIALYLAVIFAVAVSAGAFVVSVASAVFAGRGGNRFAARARQASRGAAWIFTIGSLAYLTLWWRNANAGFGWSAPTWTSFALIVAVAISLLLGHAVRIATLAVLAARRHGESLPPVSGRSWRVMIAGGGLAFAGAATLLVSTAAVDEPHGSDHPLTVVSNGRALRLIAIDGFDPAMFDAFAGDLVTRFPGTRARIEPQDTSDPARAWTTMATGVPPDVHGVHAIETRRVAGLQGRLAADAGPMAAAVGAATDLLRLTRPSIASRDERRVKTLWEVAEEAGLRTAVVNWWATWPAPAAGGIVITDRALLRLEQGGTLDGEIGPSSLYEPLRAAWPSIRTHARVAASQLQSPDAEVTAVLRRSAELDASVVGLLGALPSDQRDLDIVYLPGLDIAQHALLDGRTGASQTPSGLGTRVEALRSYYAFLRRLLDPLLSPAERTAVLIVTQPGRVDTPAAGTIASYWGGKMFVDGPPGVPNERAGHAEDIAPTVLNGLGIPLSHELTGHPLPLLLAAAPRYVDTYGRPSTTAVIRAGKPLDQETIDRLRSLGYIK
jgi:Type I phosphodiesterase / nucleotide pyrophosphatase